MKGRYLATLPFLFLPAIAHGQDLGQARVVTVCGTPIGTYASGQAAPVTQDATGKLCVNAVVSASVSAFAPNGTISATGTISGTSTAFALPAGADVIFANTGTNTEFVHLGTSNAVTATPADQPVQPGSWIEQAVGTNTYAGLITATGTTTNNMIGGSGLAAGSGGGSGGGGIGGTVTLAAGTANVGTVVATGSVSVNGGSITLVGTSAVTVAGTAAVNIGNNGSVTINGGTVVATGAAGAGLATSANQTSQITQETSIAVNTGSILTAVQSAIPAGANNIGTVAVSGGTIINNGGSVTIIPSGTQTITGTVTTTGGGSGGTSSNFGATFPAAGTAIGIEQGGTMAAANGDGSGNLDVKINAGTVAATESGNWTQTLAAGAATIGAVDIAANQSVTIVPSGTQTIAGTTTLAAGSAAIGTVAATQSGTWTGVTITPSGTQTVTGTVAATAAGGGALATAANQTNVTGSASGGTAAIDALLNGGVYNSSAPTLTNGQQAALQLDASGNLDVDIKSPATISANIGNNGSITVLGTPAVSGTVSVSNTVSVQAAAAAFVDGAIKTIGTTSDTAYSGSGSASEVSILKGIYNGVTSTGTVTGTVAATQSGTWTGVTIVPSGTQTVAGTVTAIQSLGTTNGWTPKLLNNLGTTVTNVKTTAAEAGLLQCYNSNTSQVYIQMFNTTSAGVTLGSTTPLLSVPIAPTSTGGWSLANPGLNFGTALSVAATTTATGSVAASTNPDCNIGYN